jgi:hypothetical protein
MGPWPNHHDMEHCWPALLREGDTFLAGPVFLVRTLPLCEARWRL